MKYVITAIPIAIYDLKLSVGFLSAVFLTYLGEFIINEFRR